MTVVTVWSNPAGEVLLAQLSDDEADGTPEEQIAYMGTLDAYAGFACVDPDFVGTVPDADPGLWRWSNGEIIANPAIPVSVTPRQVRLLLLQQGLLSQVEAMIAASDQATKITWEFASEFRRDDPLLLALAASPQLNLSPEQIDQFFIAASEL